MKKLCELCGFDDLQDNLKQNEAGGWEHEDCLEEYNMGDIGPDHKESQSPFVTEDDDIVIPAHVENGEIVDEQTISRR